MRASKSRFVVESVGTRAGEEGEYELHVGQDWIPILGQHQHTSVGCEVVIAARTTIANAVAFRSSPADEVAETPAAFLGASNVPEDRLDPNGIIARVKTARRGARDVE